MVVNEAFVSTSAHRANSVIISGPAFYQVGTWHGAKSLYLLEFFYSSRLLGDALTFTLYLCNT